MSFLTVDDVLDVRKREIEAKFPGVKFEFSTRVFPNHAELWVYVLDKNHYEDVRRFCEKL